jgi:hypothetical protein
MEIIDIFKNLKNKDYKHNDDKHILVEPIPKTCHKLGISIEGYPKFFIYTSDTSGISRTKILQLISVEYNLPCHLVDDETSTNDEHNYTVLTLRNDNEVLQNEFLDVVTMLLHRMSSIPTKREIAVEVENLVSIFSTINSEPKKTLQGLWAELLVIEQSKYPETLINAWHENPNAKYDFTLGADKIEVKSTSSTERNHHFSLEQLSPTKNSKLLIASIIVRESGKGAGGKTISDLRDMICQRVKSADYTYKVYNVISNTLGKDVVRANDTSFDYVGAIDTLRYYDSRDVPGSGQHNDEPNVSGINFNSNFTGAPDINDEVSQFDAKDSPLFKSLIDNL